MEAKRGLSKFMFGPPNNAWNMQISSRSHGSFLYYMLDEVPRVTSPMVYIAMFSWFAWHVEVLGLEVSDMASKLWRVGKKLTLWGALASKLPFLFLPFMVFSALSVSFVVPLGCLVGSFICLRKFYTILYQKTLVGFKRQSVLEKLDSTISGLPSSEVEISDFSAENMENESIESPYEEIQHEECTLQKNILFGETYEEEENPHEGEIHNGKPHEEEKPCEVKPHQVEVQSNPHTIRGP